MRPVLFEAFPVSMWRLMVLGAVVLCWILLLKRTARLGYPNRDIFYWLLSGLFVGFAGAMVMNGVVTFISEPSDRFKATHYLQSGLTVTGVIIFCYVYSYYYLKNILKLNPLEVLDVAAFTIPLTTAIGRIGCLMNGCCYGKLVPKWVVGTPLSIFTIPLADFDAVSPAANYFRHLPGETLIWNFQLLLSINSFVALLITEWLYRNKKDYSLPNGAVLFACLAVDALGRFFAEFLREEISLQSLMLNPWQFTTLLIFLISASWLAWNVLGGLYPWRRNKQKI